MQIVALFLLFHLIEGWLRVPPNALVFVRRRGGWRVRRRTDRDAADSLLPLRPGALAVCAAPIPLTVEADGVRSTAPVAAFGLLRAPRTSAALVPFADLASAEATGTRVRTPGTILFHAVARPQARAIAAWLRRLAPGDAAFARERVAEMRAAAAEPDALRARVAAAERTLRGATRACDAYALLLFAALPVAIAFAGETRALLAALPIALALHGVAFWLAWRAHAALLPEEAADRGETMVAALLFPPAMLRIPQRIFLAAIGMPDSAVAAAALLEDSERRSALRRALAEAEHGSDAAVDERERVLTLVRAAGLDPEALRAAPERGDPLVTGYCPICLDVYRGDAKRCTECGTPLVPFAA